MPGRDVFRPAWRSSGTSRGADPGLPAAGGAGYHRRASPAGHPAGLSSPWSDTMRRNSTGRGARPLVERLQDPAAPAAVPGTPTAHALTPNDGSVSLREAITAVNAGNDLGDPDITSQSP